MLKINLNLDLHSYQALSNTSNLFAKRFKFKVESIVK